MNFDVIVLGSGPAGFEAARRLASVGKRTAVISVTPPGGRTTVGSLVPSKVWLHAAHERGAPYDRLSDAATRSVTESLKRTVAQRVDWTRQQLESAGVTFLRGTGKLVEPGRVVFQPYEPPPAGGPATQELHAEQVVIATGSEPTFSASVRPDGARIIAPRHTGSLQEIPETLVMVGGGVTGVEYAEAFARLGARVTILSSGELLPRFDREYVRVLASHLAALGVTIITGDRVTAVTADEAADEASGKPPGEASYNTAGKPASDTASGTAGETIDGRGVTVTTAAGNHYRASMAFIATGRAADLSFLPTDSQPSGTPVSDAGGASLRARLTDPAGRFIATDRWGRTAVAGIYACGDAAGPPFTANHAIHEGRLVAAAILGDAGTLKDGVTGSAAVTPDGSGAEAHGTGVSGPVAGPGASAPGAQTSADRPPLIEAVFTQPQLAQIARREADGARSTDGAGGAGGADGADREPGLGRRSAATQIREQRKRFENVTLSAVSGYAPSEALNASLELKVQTDEDGFILSAAAIGPAAAEVLAPIQLAMQHGIRYQDLTAVPFAYPTWTEVITT